MTSDRGWEQMSNGLMWGYIPGINEADSITDSTLFSPVTFLEGFNGRLIAAYGSPGYAPWYSGSDQAGIGVYIYK
ncbi:MAG: hypothetical protein M1378_14140 [Bacteroidetes bacterium]|nr:hypothetical protein [Bacteroidota bacterium]